LVLRILRHLTLEIKQRYEENSAEFKYTEITVLLKERSEHNLVA